MSKTAEDWGWEVYVAFTARDMQRGCDLIGKAMAQERAAGRAETLANLGFDTLRADCLATYLGGYHDEREVEIFRHGMETVCNVVAAAMKRALAHSQPPREPEPVTRCGLCGYSLTSDGLCTKSNCGHMHKQPEPRGECWRCRLPLDEERVCSASGFSLLCAPPPEQAMTATPKTAAELLMSKLGTRTCVGSYVGDLAIIDAALATAREQGRADGLEQAEQIAVRHIQATRLMGERTGSIELVRNDIQRALSRPQPEPRTCPRCKEAPLPPAWTICARCFIAEPRPPEPCRMVDGPDDDECGDPAVVRVAGLPCCAKHLADRRAENDPGAHPETPLVPCPQCDAAPEPPEPPERKP